MIDRKTKFGSAAILVIALATAAWFGRDTETSTDSSTADLPAQEGAANAVLSAQPERLDESAAQVASNGASAESEFSESGVRTIFSSPDFGTDEYRQATQESATYLANYDAAWSNNMMSKTDVDALRDLRAQVESSPNGLLDSFDVSPTVDVPCVMTGIDRHKRYVPKVYCGC